MYKRQALERRHEDLQRSLDANPEGFTDRVYHEIKKMSEERRREEDGCLSQAGTGTDAPRDGATGISSIYNNLEIGAEQRPLQLRECDELQSIFNNSAPKTTTTCWADEDPASNDIDNFGDDCDENVGGGGFYAVSEGEITDDGVDLDALRSLIHI